MAVTASNTGLGPARLTLRTSIGLAAGLIVLRSLIFIVYEQAFFDSDQAIIGLMAKHLVEGAALPLFYYGQGYLLGIDAFAAAPVFLLMGPTVAALHIGVVLLNIAAVAGMIAALVRGGLTPLRACACTIFFSFAPPLTSASFIEAGANIGPIVAVPLMWLLRGSPVALGIVTALGFVNREFTLYGVVALLALDVWTLRLFKLETVRRWLVVLAAATAVVAAVEASRGIADSNGPGTRGQRPRGFSGDAATNIASRMDVRFDELAERTSVMVVDHLPELFGLRPVFASIASQGHHWLFWPVMGGVLAAVIRVLWLTRFRRPTEPPVDVGWYFTLVGAVAIAVYIISKPVDVLVPRYLLLAVFLPIGVAAVLLAVETRRVVRSLALVVIGAWTLGSAIDHAQQVDRYVIKGEPNETRAMLDALEARGITHARANYWLAYKGSFLSQERVTIASGDVVRITTYQDALAAQGGDIIDIETQPCPGGEPIELWFLCRNLP